MELIPIIYLRKRKIFQQHAASPTPLHEILGQLSSEDVLYLFDEDGIDHNKPNLCLYQRMADHCKLWVDPGSCTLGDVVDAVLTGAVSLTLRPALWQTVPLPEIEELTETDLYIHLDSDFSDNPSAFFGSSGVKGGVLFPSTQHVNLPSFVHHHTKAIASKYSLYAYESEPKHAQHWKTLGVTGLLVDFSKQKEFSVYGK